MTGRPPAWYQTMRQVFAAQAYDFPPRPQTNDQYTAWDGSVWVFSADGVWDCSNYSSICMSCGIKLDVPTDTFCAACIAIGDFSIVRINTMRGTR